MKKNDREKRRELLGFFPIFLVFAVLLCVAVWGLDSVGIINLPFVNSDESGAGEKDADVSALLERIAESEKNGTAKYVALDSSGVKHLLATGKASNYYLHEYTLSYGNAERPAVTCSVLRKVDDFNLTVFKNEKTVFEVTRSGSAARIFDVESGIESILNDTGKDFFEQMTGVVSGLDLINFVINFNDGTPSQWKFGTVETCVAEALREESVNIIRITLGYHDHTEVYMLDLDRGSIYSFESRSGGELTVKMETIKYIYDVAEMEIPPIY